MAKESADGVLGLIAVVVVVGGHGTGDAAKWAGVGQRLLVTLLGE